MSARDLTDVVARAIHEGRNGRGGTPWARIGGGHQGPYRKDARDALAAITAAGYAVVPREPTKAMIVAGQDAHDDCIDRGYDSDADGNRHDYTTISPDAPMAIFRAMLAASAGDAGDA